MAASPINDYKPGDNDNNLLRKILNRIGELIGLGGGSGSGGDVTLTVSDVEIGVVELKDGTTDTRAKVRTSDPDPSDPGLVVRNIPSGTQTVSVSNFPAVLTDAQLRASAVPISGTVSAVQSGVWTVASTQSGVWSVSVSNFPATQAVTQSGAWTVAATQSGAWSVSVSNFPASQAVTGPLTDVQLRASAVPVSGPLTDVQLRASAVPVSGPLTDAQLRASAVPVSGPLTDVQLAARVNTLGQKTMANSTPVVLASDQAAIPVSQSGAWTAAVTNAGTFAVQDSQVIADNAGFTDGTSKVFTAGFIFDEVAGTALTENDAAAGRIDSKRALVITLEDLTTRGQRLAITAANAAKVDGSAVTQPVSVTKTALTASSPAAASVGVTSAQAVASNANRKGLILVNTSVNRISLGIGSAAVLDSGITLYPGDSFSMDEYSFATSAVNAIASILASNLAIQEFTT